MIPVITEAALVMTHPESNGCPVGTYPVPASNGVVNSTFTTLHGGPADPGELIAGSFTATVPYLGEDIYSEDTSITIQTGPANYVDVVSQEVFPGDPANVVPATNNYLYANGNNTGGFYIPWSQTLTVDTDSTYTFVMYASNMIEPGGDSFANDAMLQLRINNSDIGPLYILDESFEAGGDDVWLRIEQSFQTGAAQVSVDLSIQDQALELGGDDYAITSMGLFKCEIPADHDNDGITDDVDLDDDNDGIPDATEGPGDLDNDGIANYEDLDADGNGIFDMGEAGISEALIATLDTDMDGQVDSGNPVGTNGLADDLETTPDSGQPDYDGDGSVDSLTDTDSDSVPDLLDLDSDNDGIPDKTEIDSTTPTYTATDTDGDQLANYIDPDSDNDGTSDLSEGGVYDSNDDGIVDNFTDTNLDGYDDSIAANPAPISDEDNNGIPDYLDDSIQSEAPAPSSGDDGGDSGGSMSFPFFFLVLLFTALLRRRNY